VQRFKRLLVGASVVTAAVLVGTAAYGIVVGKVGTISEKQQYVHSTDAFVTGSAAFVNVTSAGRTVVIPSGSRMINARFSAESTCNGSSGWCSVRIVVVTPAGAVIELDPAAGTDFAFDSPGTDSWESHAMERTSRFLPAGTYRVLVQAGVVGGATRIRLDDWTLAVETIRP
jgi:hypothetical protein